MVGRGYRYLSAVQGRSQNPGPSFRQVCVQSGRNGVAANYSAGLIAAILDAGTRIPTNSG